MKVFRTKIAGISQIGPIRHGAANEIVLSSFVPAGGNVTPRWRIRMTRSSLVGKLSLAGALVSAVSLGGAAAATTPPMSTHASPKAVVAAAKGATQAAVTGSTTGATNDSQDAHALAVSTAAQSDTVGGAHQNHGGYVSCVARGGTDCTSTAPTLPSHGTPPSNVTLPTTATNHRH